VASITNKTLVETLTFWNSFSEDEEVIPDNHYYHTFFAYAAFKLGLTYPGKTSISSFLTIPDKGHSEFNKYALLLTYDEFKDELDESQVQQIEAIIFDDCYSVSKETSTGNNWLFLRTIIHLKLFLITQSRNEFEQFENFLAHILAFYDDKGLFFDFPPLRLKDDINSRAFPFTYSFKMLAILIEIFGILHNKRIKSSHFKKLQSIISRAVPIHISLIAPDGDALYFGRSDNTLFGYGNVLYVLNSINSNHEFDNEIEAVEDFIIHSFGNRQDRLTEMPYSGFRDSYIYNSVYSVFFVAKYLQQVPKLESLSSPLSDTDLSVNLNSAGVTVRSKNFFVFVSGTGCNIEKKATDFSGFRYTGLTPLKLWHTENPDLVPYLFNRQREGIKDKYSNVLFVPTISFFGVSAFVGEFDEFRQVTNKDQLTLTGHAKLNFALSNGLLRRTFNKLCSRVALIRVLWGKLTFIASFCNKLFQLTREIRIDRVTGSIRITDFSKIGKCVYTLPLDWELHSEHIDSITFDTGYKSIICRSGGIDVCFDPSSKQH